MVDGGYNIEIELAIRRGLEDASVNFDLFDTGAVEFFQCRYDSGFLARSGGAVDKKVWKVAALRLKSKAPLARFNHGRV